MLDLKGISIENKDLFNEARLKQLMKAEDLSAVIGLSPANVTYLSGYHNIDQHILPEIMHAVIYPLEGEPTFMLYVNYNPIQTFVKDLRRFPGYSDRETAIMTLMDILHEKGLSGERVGIEKRYLSAHNWEVLQKEFPEVHWTDGTDVMERTRHIKTPAEVELLRAAVRSTDRAIFMAYTGARPTDTEKSVGDAMSHWAQRLGADIVSFNVIASGQRSDWGHFLGADVPLEAGSVMRCDFGAMYQGYFTDLARMAVVGRPSQRQRDTYARFLEVQKESIAAARPGVTGEELFNVSIKAHLKRGLGDRSHGGPQRGPGHPRAPHRRPRRAVGGGGGDGDVHRERQLGAALQRALPHRGHGPHHQGRLRAPIGLHQHGRDGRHRVVADQTLTPGG